MSDIRDWLEGLGLGQFAEAFEREEINPASVPHLTDGMLKELGLPMGPRAQILGAAKTLGAGSDFPEVRRAPPADYTPAPLAEKILSTRSSIEGERKQVTILFADIKGSTEIIQALDPEDARALLDPMLNIMIDAVHTYEGTVNDVQGDGIMAIFGAPIAHEDHAFRACRAALDMQDARVENRPSGSPLPAVQLRVGLNSGEVVVRAINNDLTMSYSAVGVTTHLAARMEQTAEPGTIRISRSTNRLVEGLVSAASLGDITVKGLPKPIEVFELTGLGQAQTQLEAASLESLTRFVGRSVELGYLTERLSETESGRGQVVLVVGDPGIGKSRLLMEFRRQIGSRADWHEGRCISFGQSMAFHPLIGLLRRTFGIEERDLSETARDKISVWTERIATDIVPNLPLLHYLLGAAEPDDPVQAMDPSLRRAETFEALNQLLSLESERMPQILVFEDVHWSDAATKEFIAYLLDSVPRSQILIILTTRPDYTAPVEERSFVSRLALNHLSETESKEMGERVLASAGLPEALNELVLRKAEGNPFFVEELLRSLEEAGTISRQDGNWALGRALDEVVVPDRVQDVLASRIDRLEEDLKRTLQLASVIGREFTQRLVDRIADIDRSASEVLQELQAKELIYETALHPELAYMFKHALTHEVAYGSLLAQSRRKLHQQVGTAIEELYADRLTDHFAVLGHHFSQGEDWTKAADYFSKASDHAAAASAIHEAITLGERAIDAWGRTDQDMAVSIQAILHKKLASFFVLISDFNSAHRESEQAAELARTLDDPLREGTALAGMAFASQFAHEFDRSLSEAKRAMEIAKEVGATEILASAHCTTGHVLQVTGQLADSQSNLEKSYELSRSSGAKFYQAMSASLLSLYNNWQGNYHEATSKSQESVDIARSLNLPFPLLFGLFCRGVSLTGKGDYDTALKLPLEGLTLSEKLGDEFQRIRFLNAIGWLYEECGNIERAIEYNELAAQEARLRGDPETIANSELNFADALRAKGDRNAARELLNDVHVLAGNPSTSEWMKWRYSQHLFASLGETWLALDNLGKAQEFCDQCLDLASRMESGKYLARGWRLRGEVGMARLRWEEAEEALTTALAFADRIGNPTQLWRTHAALGCLYRDTDRRDLSGASARSVRAVIEKMARHAVTQDLSGSVEQSPIFRSAYGEFNVD